MDTLKIFAASLLSRKFLLAVATIAGLLANKQYTETVAVLLGYLGVEGTADAIQRHATARATEVE